MWAVVDRARVTPERHADSVLIYCQAYGSYYEANEKITATGPLKMSGDRIITDHFVAIRDTAAKTMLDLGPDLGLSPGTGRMSWPAAETVRRPRPIEPKLKEE